MAAFHTSQIASGLSPLTVESYKSSLTGYSEFCTRLEKMPFERETLLAWKSSLSEKNKMSTVGLRMIHIDAFMKFALEFRYIPENPCSESVKKIKSAPHKPYKNLLTADEILVLLLDSAPPKGMTKSLFPRNLAIITLLLTSAARNSELRSLSPSDLDWKNCKICLTETKGDRYREVPFPQKAQEAVKAYLQSGLRPESASDTEALFGTIQNEKWQPFTRQGLSKLVERHVRMVTSHSGERSHALRHASASYMLSNGASLDVLQDLMGHSDSNTTRVYAERLSGSASTDVANKIFNKISISA